MKTEKPMQIKAMDWRDALAQNQRRTVFVISLFILIYVFLGFLLDLYIHGAFIENNFSIVLNHFLSLRALPLAMITMGGVAIISIFMTYLLHDRLMLLGTDYHEVTEEQAITLQEKQLYHVVEELRIAAGLRYMPKVYIIDADYMNAFASGYSERSAMIAITRGLLGKLERSELQAVIAHELSHIRHGDIKLTLMATVLSNLMLIVLDLFFYNVIYSRDDRKKDNKLLFMVILLRYLLPVITVLLMLYLSRTREYMADAGAVELIRDNYPLGKALLKIHQDHEANHKHYRAVYSQHRHEDIRRAAYIFDPVSAGLQAVSSINHLFSTHPPLEERLKALGFGIE
jgi:heat shock protein HtpX